MFLRVHQFQIDQQQFAFAHYLTDNVRLCQERRIDSPVERQFAATVEQFHQIVGVHQGFAATESNTAAGAIHHRDFFPDLLHQILNGIFRAGHFHRQRRTSLDTFATEDTELRIGNNSLARQLQCVLRTNLDTRLAPDALLLRIKFFLMIGYSFRIMAPYTRQRTSLQENRDADARAVVDAIAFDIKN